MLTGRAETYHGRAGTMSRRWLATPEVSLVEPMEGLVVIRYRPKAAKRPACNAARRT
jgi:hypothetical protein